jgi:DnaB-like helicase N terminal domain/AAA domain
MDNTHSGGARSTANKSRRTKTRTNGHARPSEVKLPHDPDAERAFLGSILLENACLQAIEGTIETNDLYLPSHRMVYDSIVRLVARGEVANEVTVGADLRMKGLLEQVGGIAYISSLKDGVPQYDYSFVRNYARIIRKTAQSRKVMNLGQNLFVRGGAGEDVNEILTSCRPDLDDLYSNANGVTDWRALFHTIEDFEKAPPLSFAIDGFLQNDAATIFGALSGHSKTWVQLSLAKALLKGEGTKLWDYFDVRETAERVIYLIPESPIGPFAHRLKLMGLLDYVREGRLLVRTLSAGPRPSLVNPALLAAAKGAYVMLDTLARFNEAENENSAAEFQALASNIFGLLAAGARSVTVAHHAPKSFEKEMRITLEGVLRGSGDIGAIFATGWGFKQIDKDQNVIHLENVKPRDFRPCGAFQLIGRPYLDETGDFAMHKWPGECGSLLEECGKPGGAPPEKREERTRRVEMVRRWLDEDADATVEELRTLFAREGIDLSRSAVKNYRREAAQ